MRTAVAGGPPRSDVKPNRKVKLRQHDEIVLFIHGFNVDSHAGREAYSTFQENLSESRRAAIFWVLWPGDQFVDDKASALAYSWMPRRAEDCALMLAKFLSGSSEGVRDRKQKVYIVAHSLGCRLALEMVRNLSVNAHRFDVRLVALMAAAVPVYMVKQGQRLSLLDYGGAKTRILFSKRDAVLKYVFRLGQRFESSSPGNWLFGRHALGRKGLPTNFASNRRISEEETRLGHGEYWANVPVARSLAPDLPSNARALDGRIMDLGGASNLVREDPVGRQL